MINPTAILWFDNDVRTSIEAKIAKGVAHYTNRYGRPPTLCMVNPCMIEALPVPAEILPGVRLAIKRYVMPNHFWIGQTDEQAGAQ